MKRPKSSLDRIMSPQARCERGQPGCCSTVRSGSAAEILCEAPASVAVDHAHLVVAEPIYVVLVEEEGCVIDEKLPYRGVPVREHEPAVCW